MKKLFLFIAALTLSAGLAHTQESTEPDPMPTPENNQIVYRTSDHQKITLNNPNYFGVAYNDANSVCYQEADYGVVSFDGDITTIGDWAFANRTTLTAVVWPSTVTSIGENAQRIFQLHIRGSRQEVSWRNGRTLRRLPVYRSDQRRQDRQTL